MRVYGKYYAGLIALYLVVYNASKAGILMKEGAAGGVKLTKALQGR
ncbi:hypothetical protein ABZ341_41725 [Streptomyces sp. NPDC006173]